MQLALFFAPQFSTVISGTLRLFCASHRPVNCSLLSMRHSLTPQHLLSTGARTARTLALLLTSMGAFTPLQAEQQPINCALPHSDTRINECSTVLKASAIQGCLSNADVSGHSCIVMDANLTFCNSEVSVPVTALFDQSNRTLDCQGGSIDHGWGRQALDAGPATTKTNSMPAVRLYDDRSLSGITVRNCTIRGTNHIGIDAKRFFGGQLGGDGILSDDEPLPEGHSDLVFEDLIIQDTGLGIYLGAYSDNIAISRVQIDNSRRIAIYSEAGSHDVRITHSLITNNNTREAVAIDSTYNSEVSNTLFVNNREGGINLYQNCGELKGIVCPVLRPTPANNNRIINNTFVNTGVSGVQIASRQGRNHSLGWCATLNGQPGQFTDTAQDNRVEGNRFSCTQGTAIIVKDGPNLVRNNTIEASDRCVPFEISTGGLGPEHSALLDGIHLTGNIIEAVRPPRLRNLSPKVRIDH